MSKDFMKYFNVKEVLPFAGDFESAHVAHNYPYGSLRTDMKFWVEYRRGKGFRAVTCSLNPKTGRWNKPHAGTYTQAMALYLENETNHIKFAGFSHYDRECAADYMSVFESGLSPEGRQAVDEWIFVHKFTDGRNTLDRSVFLDITVKTYKAMKEKYPELPDDWKLS